MRKYGPYLWPTVAERFFSENKASIRSRHTVMDWSSTFRQLHDSFSPLKRIEQYNKEDLKRYLTDGTSPNGERWAGGTVAKKRTAIKSLFSWAFEVDLVDADPSSYLSKSVRVQNVPVRTHLWLEEPQLDALLAVCPDDLRGLRDRVALALGCYAGLRASEISNLRWPHVFSDHLLVVAGKGEKTAEAPMGRRLKEMLDQWKAEYAKGLGAIPLAQPVLCRWRSFADGPIGTGLNQSVPWWATSITRQGIGKIVRLHGSEVGFPGLAPHDLRRSFAGVLQDKGVPVEKISQALRHSNVATTSTYLSKNPRKVRDALRAVDFG